MSVRCELRTTVGTPRRSVRGALGERALPCREAGAGLALVLAVVFAAGCRSVVPPTFDIVHAVTPLTIDGRLDEAVWQQAAPVAVNYRLGAVGQTDPAPTMRARFAWDEHFLYIGYEVWDTQLVAVTDGREKGPPGNRRLAVLPWAPEQKVDCVELFLSFGDQRVLWEVQHNAANHLNEAFTVVLDPQWPIAQSELNFLGLLLCSEQYLLDDGPATVQRAVHLLPRADGKPSTVNDASDVDTGYTGELRLPWGGLGAPKAARAAAKAAGRAGWDLAGQELLVLAVRLDGNGKDGWAYHHNSPTLPPKGMFASRAAYYPRGRLVERRE